MSNLFNQQKSEVPVDGLRPQAAPEPTVQRDPAAPVAAEVPEAAASHITLHPSPEGQPVVDTESPAVPVAAPAPTEAVDVVVPGVDNVVQSADATVETPQAPGSESSVAGFFKRAMTENVEDLGEVEREQQTSGSLPSQG